MKCICLVLVIILNISQSIAYSAQQPSTPFSFNIQHGGSPFDKSEDKGAIDYPTFLLAFDHYPWLDEIDKTNADQNSSAPAKKSILIENQYIRSSQTEIARLLDAIHATVGKHAGLDVRIVLGKLFGQKDYDNEVINIANIKKLYKLKLDTNIRYIDTTRFVHCHNKVIIVDEEKVLVSSQNWSNTGVSSNREAGIILEYPEIAVYYAKIFESDWSTANPAIPHPGKTTATPEDLHTGKFVKVVAADYQEV
jgi:PLD-like domain